MRAMRGADTEGEGDMRTPRSGGAQMRMYLGATIAHDPALHAHGGFDTKGRRAREVHALVKVADVDEAPEHCLGVGCAQPRVGEVNRTEAKYGGKQEHHGDKGKKD